MKYNGTKKHANMDQDDGRASYIINQLTIIIINFIILLLVTLIVSLSFLF